jgi:hypothetical protein
MLKNSLNPMQQKNNDLHRVPQLHLVQESKQNDKLYMFEEKKRTFKFYCYHFAKNFHFIFYAEQIFIIHKFFVVG